MIFLYNFLWILLLPIILVLMIVRIVTGKEDILRIQERLGLASIPKSSRKIIWIHAASLGESKIALTLSKNLRPILKGDKILITTGTIVSANYIRKNLEGSIIHQFAPLDNLVSVMLFLKYWKPKLGIFIECELWPNLSYFGAKVCPLLLVNARMSDKSFSKWTKFKFIASSILQNYKIVLCQSDKDCEKYRILGADDALAAGNLKFSDNKLPVPPHKLRILKTQTKDRKIFVAASTHPEDEKLIVAAHKKMRKKFPEFLTIIAPRHPIRSSSIASFVKSKGLSLAVRSGKDKITDKTDIYLADTIGELGLFFSIAKASFIGGSFQQGGHNLIEPAYFNIMMLIGPNMTNCQEVADEFIKIGAAHTVRSTKDICTKLEQIYSEELLYDTKQSRAIIKKHVNVVNKYLSYIKKYL